MLLMKDRETYYQLTDSRIKENYQELKEIAILNLL